MDTDNIYTRHFPTSKQLKQQRREEREREAVEEQHRYNALSFSDKIREADDLETLKELLAQHFEGE